MKKKQKKIPDFKTEGEERRFWLKHDSTDYIDWRQAKQGLFSKLQPSTKTISLRLPEMLLAQVRREARKRDVPYQSLIKIWLAEQVKNVA